MAEKLTGLDGRQGAIWRGSFVDASLYASKMMGTRQKNPRLPLVLYRKAAALPDEFDPAAIFEELFAANGWRELVARWHVQFSPLLYGDA